MAEDGAMPMPQADGCCESLDSQVAQANRAKELVERLERTFDGSGYRDLVLSHDITVGVIENARKLINCSHAYSRADVTFNEDGNLVLRIVSRRAIV